MPLQPFARHPAQPLGKGDHLPCFLFGNGTHLIVNGHMALLAALVEKDGVFGSELIKGKSQAFNRPLMFVLALGLISRGRHHCRRQLQGGIVGNVKSPFRLQIRHLGLRDVAVGDRQQPLDFVARRLVRLDPAVLQVNVEVHARRR